MKNHYYAFGLRIAGISSRKLADGTGNEGQVKNEFGYNDKELFDDGDLNWSDYGFRNYDAQIGRFVQIDPLADSYDGLTSYHYAANEPIGNVDIDGLGVGDVIKAGVQAGTYGTSAEVIVSAVRKTASTVASNTGSIGNALLKGLKFAGGALAQAGRLAYDGAVSGARTFNTYLNPLASAYEFITGKSTESDFTADKSRAVSGVEAGISLIPGAKGGLGLLKAGEKAFVKALPKFAPKVEAAVAKEGSKYLYHYTSKEAAKSISQQGLKVGRDGFSYLTNKGNLSPLQAQIELALPANRSLPNSVLRIDVSGLRPSLVRRISGNLQGYGAGGGTEFLFDQHIPANLIKVIK